MGLLKKGDKVPNIQSVDENGNLIKGEGSSTLGYRASGVPGTLAGFDLAFKKYGSGKITWSDLVRPAREIAQPAREMGQLTG